jgi:hypothetical protein
MAKQWRRSLTAVDFDAMVKRVLGSLGPGRHAKKRLQTRNRLPTPSSITWTLNGYCASGSIFSASGKQRIS